MESIDLNKIPVQETEGHTSKGNQLKWKLGDQWYKADHMGYEGLSEVLVSRLVRVVIQHFLKTIVVQFVFEVIG